MPRGDPPARPASGGGAWRTCAMACLDGLPRAKGLGRARTNRTSTRAPSMAQAPHAREPSLSARRAPAPHAPLAGATPPPPRARPAPRAAGSLAFHAPARAPRSAGAARGAGSCARACRAFERSPDTRPAPSPPRSRALLLALAPHAPAALPRGRMDPAPARARVLAPARRFHAGAWIGARAPERAHERGARPTSPRPSRLLVLLLPLGSAAGSLSGSGDFRRSPLDTSARGAILSADSRARHERATHTTTTNRSTRTRARTTTNPSTPARGRA
jgi:hypothetical protein